MDEERQDVPEETEIEDPPFSVARASLEDEIVNTIDLPDDLLFSI